MSKDFLVRVYNEQTEDDVKEFGPVHFDHDGSSFIIQPACGVYERTKVKRIVKTEDETGQARANQIEWKKTGGAHKKNYLDLKPAAAAWAMSPGSASGNLLQTRQFLKTYDDKAAEVEKDLEAARAEARAVREETAKMKAELERAKTVMAKVGPPK